MVGWQAANCLVDQRGAIKLADFGMSKRIVVSSEERYLLCTFVCVPHCDGALSSVCLVCLSVCMSLSVLCVCLSACLPVCLSLSLSLSVSLSPSLSLCLCLSVSVSLSLSLVSHK